MSDNYLKISQVPLAKLDTLVPDNNQLILQSIDLDCNLIDLVKSIQFIKNSITIPEESISITLLNDVNKLKFKADFKTSFGSDKTKLFVEVNNKIPVISAQTTNNIDITIIEFIQKINSLLISGFILDSAGIIKESKNIIQTLLIDNQLITSFEANLSGLTSLEILNCPTISYFNCGQFNNIKKINISNTFASGNITIGKLDTNPTINLSNNHFNYIELEGNNSNLTLENCILLPQKDNVLSYVKFINCTIDSKLITLLENNSISIEII